MMKRNFQSLSLGLLILGLCGVWTGSCFYSSSAVADQAAGTQNKKNPEAVIIGEIKASPECSTKNTMVWLAQNKMLYYQIEVPPQGDFKFHVIPGDYTLSVTSPQNCFVKQDVDAIEGKTKTVKLELVSSKKKREPAQYVDSRGAGCLTIDGGGPCLNSPPFAGPSYIQPSWYPWWMYYGSQYNNFYNPYAYNPAPVFPEVTYPYPGYRPIAYDKPNIYVSGPKNESVHVGVTLKDSGSNWLTTSPAYDNSAWNGTLTGDGHIKVGKAEYPYLFYDFRGPDESLQTKRGFCGTRAEVLEKMARGLDVLGFKKNEVADFNSYWRIKMPQHSAFCVFPQENKELDPVAELKISPSPHSVIRIVYIVTYKNGDHVAGSPSFKNLPEGEWNPVNAAYKRIPATSSQVEVREWGVAFSFAISKL
jgi:hypothetical protein